MVAVFHPYCDYYDTVFGQWVDSPEEAAALVLRLFGVAVKEGQGEQYACARTKFPHLHAFWGTKEAETEFAAALMEKSPVPVLHSPACSNPGQNSELASGGVADAPEPGAVFLLREPSAADLALAMCRAWAAGRLMLVTTLVDPLRHGLVTFALPLWPEKEWPFAGCRTVYARW